MKKTLFTFISLAIILISCSNESTLNHEVFKKHAIDQSMDLDPEFRIESMEILNVGKYTEYDIEKLRFEFYEKRLLDLKKMYDEVNSSNTDILGEGYPKEGVNELKIAGNKRDSLKIKLASSDKEKTIYYKVSGTFKLKQSGKTDKFEVPADMNSKPVSFFEILKL